MTHATVDCHVKNEAQTQAQRTVAVLINTYAKVLYRAFTTNFAQYSLQYSSDNHNAAAQSRHFSLPSLS
jgi:hypothetical protein